MYVSIVLQLLARHNERIALDHKAEAQTLKQK